MIDFLSDVALAMWIFIVMAVTQIGTWIMLIRP